MPHLQKNSPNNNKKIPARAATKATPAGIYSFLQ